MSARTRLIWIIPAVLIASWLAVRSLAARPNVQGLDDPPAPLAAVAAQQEVIDPALAQLIGRFAAEARTSN
jgi:hypothetical protein